MSTKNTKAAETKAPKAVKLPAVVSLQVSYVGPRGEHVQKFATQAQANGFYRYKARQGQTPKFVTKAKKAKAKKAKAPKASAVAA